MLEYFRVQMSKIWCWGSDGYGRLGLGTEDCHKSTPTLLTALDSVKLRAMSCGAAHVIAVDTEGRCYSWGKCHMGQLGHGEMDEDVHSPLLIKSLAGVKVRTVATGDSHVMLITEGKMLYNWGCGMYGCLGDGTEQSCTTPRVVEALKHHKVAMAAGGAFHSMAVTEEGQLYSWGRDSHGQLCLPPYAIEHCPKPSVRLNKKVPTIVELPRGIKSLSTCSNHTLVLLEGNILLSFGNNDHGQLGRQQKTLQEESLSVHLKNCRELIINYCQVLIKDDYIIATIATGWSNCAVTTSNGDVITWGSGSHGELGHGDEIAHNQPTVIKQFTGHPSQPRVHQLECGEQHNIALTEDGEVWTWGINYYNKLGLPVDSGSVSCPRKVPVKMEGVNYVLCGTNHCMAVHLQQ